MKSIYPKNTLLTIVISLLLAIMVGDAIAQASDEMAIESTIKQQWDKPDNPLQVYPIVIVDQHAIAGWTQGERGGRALLRRGHHGWEVYMCGGEDLTNKKVLEQAGINVDTAELLASKLKAAEQGMSLKARKQLSIFEGVVPVKANQHHAH